MLHLPTIWHSILEATISLHARIHHHATGGWYQLGLLRLMGVQVEGPVAIAAGTSFLGAKNLHLGKYVSIGAHSRIVCWGKVEIGDDFMSSDFLNLNSGTHDLITLAPTDSFIRIGHRVWCGTKVTICAGVEIGDDVIIGAGSVVTKSIPSNSVAVGVPAKVIRSLERPTKRTWSAWPERAAGGHLEHASTLKKRLHWLRARI